MGIRKVKGGYVVVHHKVKGKVGRRVPATKKPVPYKKALSIHRAIWWRKGLERKAHFRKGRKVRTHGVRRRR